MAKRKHREEQELPFVALMDTMTNVVGVLIIVLVMVGISIANAVKNILSDLPPVTPEEYRKMLEVVKELPPPPADPKKLEEDKKIAEQKLKKAIDDLKTIDVSAVESQMKFMDLETFRKKLEDARKLRIAQKAEVDKLIAEVERLKALLDQTPVFKPDPPTYVRLPNPRPFPEKPNETRILVAKQGVLFFNEKEFIKPVLDGLEKIRSQFEYKEVKIDPFAKMLESIFGNAKAAQTAWPELAPLVNTFQLDQVALAYKALVSGGLPATKQVLNSVGNLALATRSTMPVVAEAIVGATKGDLTKWTALDPTRDPLAPIIKATSSGGKINFSWGANLVSVKNTPKDILDYFVKDLGGLDAIKKLSADKIIYDAFKLTAILERAAASPMMNSSSYTFAPSVKPGNAYVQLALTPKGGGGETREQIVAQGSAFQRLMRQIKADEKGVAVFQVMTDAFPSYLDARKIADEIGVAATWEFLAKLDITMNVTGYEVQRFAVTTTATRPGNLPPAVRITAPKRSLD
jgi:hypothetical protein